MPVLAITWLYIIGMMAATTRSLATGAVLFLVIGVVPIALVVWLKISQLKARRARAAAQLPRRSASETTPTEADNMTKP